MADLLGDLDALDADGCAIASGVLGALTDKDVAKETKVKLVNAMPVEAVAGMRTNSVEFEHLMREWERGTDDALRAAAKRVLGKK